MKSVICFLIAVPKFSYSSNVSRENTGRSCYFELVLALVMVMFFERASGLSCIYDA